MRYSLIDTNVIVRYLVENPATIDKKFKGVYRYFQKLETGRHNAGLIELVLFQCYFVLTSFYRVSRVEAAEKLARLLTFKGIHMADKEIATACMKILQKKKMDIVDAYFLVWSEVTKISSVYSYDKELEKQGLKLLKIG